MSGKSILISTVLITLVTAGSTFAQLPQVADKPAGIPYPFSAEVTGNDVYIRTGNSVNDYHSGKVNKGFKVTVVDEVLGWAKILPPEGSYSWISKSYVTVNAANPNTGVVTGDSVRVWAGSDYREPLHSPGLQTKLNAGEIVELMPDQPENSDYFKIKPPVGAHLWISAEYLKFASSVEGKPVVVPPRPDAAGTQRPSVQTPATDIPPSMEQSRPVFTNIPGQEGQAAEQGSQAVTGETSQPPAAEKPAQPDRPAPATKESQYLAENYELGRKIDEIAKQPLDQQDYTEVKQALEAIKSDADAGRAAAFAQILLERIGRYELAASAIHQVQQQDKNLQRTREQIEKAHQAQLSKLPKEADYLYTGILKPSFVYSDEGGPRRYLLTDANGKIISYLTPATAGMSGKMDSLAGKKVGVKGTIASNARSLVTLVNVTEVDPMK
jgi:uncharacterized protein YgiM (DUF1202 family)